ncbi:MAG: hypothetical protein GY842_02465 [bacterium]|nr:hypothetical protein [bacterium]
MPSEVSTLPARLQGPMQEYVALIQALAVDRLLAITLFGAAADSGEGGPSGQIQSVVVLDPLDLELVRELGAQGASLGRMRIQAPLLMTPEYITASVDVFPVELLDIQRRHLCVLGRDYFSTLEFTRADVRLQLEREFKRELIQLRQGILSAGGRTQAMEDIYWAAAEQTMLLLRAVLWLHGKPVPDAAAGIAQSAATACGVDLSGLKPALAGVKHVDFQALDSLYTGIIELADHVDGITV